VTYQRALADALGYRERLVKRAMQNQPDAARLGRLRVRELELTQYLRLADHHRIETRADAEQMARGVAAGETVNRIRELGLRDSSIGGQKFERLIRRARRIDCDSYHLDPIAGRNQRRLRHHRRRLAQPTERGHDLSVGERKPFTQRDGGAAMVYSHDE
jgi:hypothetical protein